MVSGCRVESGLSLLEVLIAAAVLVILALAFLGNIVAAALGGAGNLNTNQAVNVARQTMEEVLETPFLDTLGLDGDTLLTTDGMAVRISVVQASVGLDLIEVTTCRPVPAQTLAQLQALSLQNFKTLKAAPGSLYSLVTMKHQP